MTLTDPDPVIPRDGLGRPLVIPPGGGKPEAYQRTTTLLIWENKSGSGSATNTHRSLTRSSAATREGLGMQPTAAKTCAHCKRDLPPADFGLDKRTPDGHDYVCRKCRRDARAVLPERPVTVTSKTCSKCKREMPADQFPRDKRMASGLGSWCRKCLTADQKRRWDADPERAKALNRVNKKKNYSAQKQRRWTIKGLYGLTPEAYDALLEAQGGRCAVCRTDTPGGKTGMWHVDHCHNSSDVRGLLCAGCNVGIGHLGDDPQRMRAAAAYIERHRNGEL